MPSAAKRAWLLCARPGIAAIALALVFGLFNLIYGIWMLVRGIELRRTSTTLRGSALPPQGNNAA